MKTLKLRKKALLSSVAMLLVAMLALGTATYAWYSINRTVTADSMSVTASTPGGLMISKTSDTAGFGTEVSLDNMTATLNPAQLTYGASGVASVKYFDGTAEDNGAAYGTEKNVTVENGLGSYYVMDQIWVKSTSAVDGTVQATVKATDANTNSYTNIVLVDAADGTIFGGNEFTTGVARSGVTKINGTTNVGSPVDYSNGTVKSYYVVVYVDGQNSNCTTANATAAALQAIDFELQFTLTDK
ncbi:MAG: hypothetical protein ACI4QE_01950 [Acutalibacteraceae bacterium]